MEIPSSKALEIIGQQQIEIVVLRERLTILSSHVCVPCSKCADAKPEKPST